MLATSTADQLTQLDRTGQPFDPVADQRGRTEQLLGVVLLGAGAAVLVTGGVLYLLGRREARIALTPRLSHGNGAAITWSF